MTDILIYCWNCEKDTVADSISFKDNPNGEFHIPRSIKCSICGESN